MVVDAAGTVGTWLAVELAGDATHRQIDKWCRDGLFQIACPGRRGGGWGGGRGGGRGFNARDVLRMRAMGRATRTLGGDWKAPDIAAIINQAACGNLATGILIETVHATTVLHLSINPDTEHRLWRWWYGGETPSSGL